MLQAGEGGPVEVCKYVKFASFLCCILSTHSNSQTFPRANDLLVRFKVLNFLYFE